MSRTARLFKLMDALRGHRRPVTAARLAETLSVSVRTVYRDVQTLNDLGAPIAGEAGIGYLLRPGFFLPPLMFGEDELEALVLGARWVQGQGDPTLAQAAASALAKIGTASPKDLRDKIADTGLWAPQFRRAAEQPAGLRTLREAMRSEHNLTISYVDETGTSTDRVVWPVAVVSHCPVFTSRGRKSAAASSEQLAKAKTIENVLVTEILLVSIVYSR